MDNLHSEQPDRLPAAPAVTTRPGRSGQARRIAATAGAGVALLAAGAGIGIALTGGASASPGSAGTTAASPAGQAASRCAHIVAQLRSSGHPAAAVRIAALCKSPLLRLALVGGEYGQVTFGSKTGPRTIAVERGTVQSVTRSQFTVRAPDGTTLTWDITASTAFREASQATTRAALGRGDQVLVGGLLASGAHDARLVRIRPAGATSGTG